MSNIKSISVFLFYFLFFISSVGCQERERSKRPQKVSAEQLIEVNKYLVGKDSERIKAYLERSGEKMEERATGMWYSIEEEGEGLNAAKGNVVSIKYEVSLLDGTVCYSSDSLGLKSFRLGQGGVEYGLEDALLMMKKGGKAKFILPPHLAHGLLGDEDRIPARSIIIYNVELVDIKK